MLSCDSIENIICTNIQMKFRLSFKKISWLKVGCGGERGISTIARGDRVKYRNVCQIYGRVAKTNDMNESEGVRVG